MEITRRDFLKTSAFVGGCAALSSQIEAVFARQARLGDGLATGGGDFARAMFSAENVIYSVCLNCHVACPIQVRVVDGVAVKVGGNPYSSQNLLEPIPMDTPPAEAARVEGKLCPKGQASIQILYDPYRLRKVLKRAGKRGENKWVTVDFNQAIDEIVNGGDLFGEGHVPGLKDIYALRDADVFKDMGADAKSVGQGKMSVDEFKSKWAQYLDTLIDPNRPDLGPKNNQFVFQAGRIEHGRKELGKRFTGDGFGSVNFYEHTTICEQSHHIAYYEATGKHHMKPDTLHSEFVIFFGTGAFEANFGPTPMAERVTQGLRERNFKYAVVDPRLSKTAGKAWRWVPIQPGTDAALALGLIRWIMDNERYDARYLENPNNDAAKADGEVNSTDATHLVRTDTMLFLTPEDAGLERPVDKDGNPVKDVFVVMAKPVEEGATPQATLHTETEAGVLDFAGEVNGVPVKTVFTLLRERAQEKTIEEYAQICGLEPSLIEELAEEFTSHGKKAAAEMYRGPVQHTNGYYNGQAIITLNALIGNTNWKGGLTAGSSHWHEDGSKKGQPFPKATLLGAPGGYKKFGHTVSKEKSRYEDTSFYQEKVAAGQDPYPAERPWYPFTGNLYQEVIPAAAAGYPYPIKCLLVHKGTPAFASPAGHLIIEALSDPQVIPLFIACDVTVAETSMYADYIIPDLTYMERWGTPHTTPDVQIKLSKIRQPTVAPITEMVTVDGEDMPIGLEAFLIAVGKKLGLPGFGKGGFGEGGDFNRPEDFFLRLAANLAFGDKEDGSQALPDASDEEMAIFRAARAHLPKGVFDEARWAAAAGEMWPKVVTLLNRGGRADPTGTAYKGDYIGHLWKGTWHLYAEGVARQKHSMTGQPFDGLPHYEPVLDAAGNVVNDDGYDFSLITYKEIFGGQSRTAGSYWVQDELEPENRVWMYRGDARRLGLRDGDVVKLSSASNPAGVWDLGNGRKIPVQGKVKTVEGMRPGTVAVSWHYGHWAYGAGDVVVDRQVVKGDPRRARGLCPNAIMLADPALGDVCLTDPIGGSASFYDTKVKVVKV